MLHKETKDRVLIALIEHTKTNTLTLNLLYEIKETILQVQESSEVDGLILSGYGNCFCTGIDINALLQVGTPEEAQVLFNEYESVLSFIFRSKKPVVTAINGHAIGGGLLLGLCGDYKLISNNEKIKIGCPEIKIGLSLTPFMIALLTRNSRFDRNIRALVYSGDFISPKKLFEMGCIDGIISPDVLIEKAVQWIKKISVYSRESFSSIKQAFNSNILNMQMSSENQEGKALLVSMLLNEDTKNKLRTMAK